MKRGCSQDEKLFPANLAHAQTLFYSPTSTSWSLPEGQTFCRAMGTTKEAASLPEKAKMK